MTYRDDLQAARMRREALNNELRQLRSRKQAYQALVQQEQALEQELAQCSRDLEEARARAELPLLQQVRVASPCKERWDDMSGDERVRFCGRCEKNVYDLSALDAAQAEELLRERGESMCVRFFRRADGTVLTSDCPVGGKRKRFWRRVTTAAAASGLAAAGIAMAPDTGVQGDGQTRPTVHIECASQPADSAGRVARKPVPVPASEPPEVVVLPREEWKMGSMAARPTDADILERHNQRIEETRARLEAAKAERIAAERELERLKAEARALRKNKKYRSH